ncbi:MAG: FtsQ-type POTRA domain-containing protein [Mogibacterium sp.]|nr:FtsQ-type POTRA domain-containing protein [Mogibacterium sp.]
MEDLTKTIQLNTEEDPETEEVSYGLEGTDAGEVSDQQTGDTTGEESAGFSDAEETGLPEEPEETDADERQMTVDTIEYTLLPHEVPELAEELKAYQAAVENKERKTKYGLPVDHPEMGELARKQEARRKYKENKNRKFRTSFYVGATILIVAVFCLIFSLSGFFTVDSIEVRGNSHYTAEEIINMSHAMPGRNIIYDANKQETIEYLEQNPYIKSASVSRKLPSTLVIKVVERTEKMAFMYDDDYLVMDDEGILLKKTRNAPKTTLIEGLIVNKIKLGEKIGTENNKLFNKAIKLIRSTSDADLYFVRIDMSDESKIKAYIYETMIVKTDYDTLMTNIKNGRLHLVLEKLFSDGIKRGTITFEEDGSASFQPIIE